MDVMEKLAPTREAVDGWRKKDGQKKQGYGADIRTKAGSWRCVTGYAVDAISGDPIGYWTIRAEGSSREGKETWIAFADIVEARGWQV